MKGLKSKNVLIREVTSGINRAIAYYSAIEKARVIVNYRNDPKKLESPKESRDRLYTQAKGCGGKKLSRERNILQEADTISVCHQVSEKLDSSAILTNNTDIKTAFLPDRLITLDFNKLLEINLSSSYFCLRQFIRYVLDRAKDDTMISVFNFAYKNKS